MSVTIAQICDAVKNYLSTAASLKRSESYNQLTEGINDYPLMQVYWQSIDCDWQSNTERTTFQGGVKQKDLVIHADLYGRPRSHLGEDNAAVTVLANEVVDLLEATGCPPFGLTGLKNFKWRGERVVFDYDGVLYAGIRFYVNIRVF